MNYLEEKIHVIKLVVEALQAAVDKSKTWLEDKSDNKSLTYCDLCQQLESATLALLDVSSLILSENKDHVDTDEERPCSSQSMQQTEKRDQIQTTDQFLKDLHKSSEILSRLEQIETARSSLQDVSRLEQIETAISSLQDVSRLEQIETAISSLQDANDKSTDDISEIKQWRDNFVTEQSDMVLNIKQKTIKQNRILKNHKKQISKQGNQVKELIKEFESLKEKETKFIKTLEKLSQDMNEYENNLDKINNEVRVYRNKTHSLTQDIKNHYDLIVSLQEDNNKIKVNLSTKFEKIQSELGNVNNTISRLSSDFNVIESRVYNKYVCHVSFDDPTPVCHGSVISTFDEVREYNGQHFNRTTGKFVSPHDGLYLVCVTLHEWGIKLIGVGVMVEDMLCTYIEVNSVRTNAAGSAVVDMKKGQELYCKMYCPVQDAHLSCYSSFTIVSL
ncbi:uncharacterized protein LOC131933550 [Physella acuta]|uniref:uncharacterized protein LOC131933550 n=1 Tax=Physella acuta TaxID=109671 RepID=UPI0027DB58C8|nr:uncharacterized protein LOC131933550 [Physella acuta]